MDENANDQPTGAPETGESGAPAGGTPGAEPGGQVSPTGQDGAQPDPKDEQIKTMKGEIRNLNKALVEARRGGRQQLTPQGQGGEQVDPFSDPGGQYAISLEIAENRLRSGLENIVSLYPEISPEEVARIRTNPWAFASRQSFMNGDYETALLEIEMKLAERVEQLAAADQKPQGKTQETTPATVGGNPVEEPTSDEDVEPGSEEDENPWTMPLPKLERLKNKAVAKMSQPKQ